MKIKTMGVSPEPILADDSEQGFVVTTDLGRFFVQMTLDGTAHTSGPFVQPASPLTGAEAFSLMVQTAYHTAWRKVGGVDAVCRNKGQQQQAFFAALATELGVPHLQGDTYVPLPVSPFWVLHYVHWIMNEVGKGRSVGGVTPVELRPAEDAFKCMSPEERWGLLTLGGEGLVGAPVKIRDADSERDGQVGKVVRMNESHIGVVFVGEDGLGICEWFQIKSLVPA